MSHVNTHHTTVSALQGRAVYDESGAVSGRIAEFLVSGTDASTHVSELVLTASGRLRGKDAVSVALRNLSLRKDGTLHLRGAVSPQTPAGLAASVCLERDLLDQQIIDVHGRKVVRVNDVDLVWESTDETVCDLRIAEVEVGMRGAVRRLLKGLPPKAVNAIAAKFPPQVIPWEFVDLIDRDPARRVRLKVESDRLSRMHPADIADILEDLAPAERDAVFTSLNEEVAAEALEEVDPKERQEVEDLLEFEEDEAAGRMTTEYVAVPELAVVSDAVDALRAFEGSLETVTEIFLVDGDGKLKGVVNLSRILLASGGALLDTIKEDRMHCCHVETKGKEIAAQFDKYNLRALPVVGGDGRMEGVILAEHVIALLREGK